MIRLACPRCHKVLDEPGRNTSHCSRDDLTFYRVGGIWRMLMPERKAYFGPFIRDFETVRRLEGRGSGDAGYYRTLPYIGSADWRMRAASFDVFVRRVLLPREPASGGLQILDLGAGNGWLSNRLAQRGHDVAAVDLTVNDFDGLACCRFYEDSFLPVQAEFDHLPFVSGDADVVVFNSSLHYSTDYAKTLTEAFRVLAAGGLLVILDSPVYRDPSSGLRMVQERQQGFTQRFGFPSNNLPSENYLTYERLDELAGYLGVKWQMITPFRGLKWLLRPCLRGITRRREPARFPVILGRPK